VTSGLGIQASEFRFQVSGFGFQVPETAGLTPDTCVLLSGMLARKMLSLRVRQQKEA
jgi:hypothetical protein